MSLAEFLQAYGSLVGGAVAGLCGGFGAYVAVRVDLAKLQVGHHERITNVERLAISAHDRIDDLLNRPRSRSHDSL